VSGRTERRDTDAGRIRRPNLRRYYSERLDDIRPGSYRFRFLLIRPPAGAVVLDPIVEDCSWTDEGAVLTGSMTVRRPDPNDPSSLPVGIGQRVRCQVQRGADWYTLWQMRIASPQTDAGEGTMSFDLADDLEALRRARRDWSFRTTKRRPRGWTPEQITREVCRRRGLKVGRLARSTTRIKRLKKKDVSDLMVLREAWQKERDASGRRFVIQLRDGALDIVALQRNRVLYVFEDQIQSALTTQQLKAHPITVLHARGRIGKGKGARKVTHTEYRRAVVERFGRIEADHDFGEVDSLKDLREQARRWYAKRVRVKREAQLSVPCVPFIRRGDGARWLTNEPGWSGASLESRDRSFVFVTSVTHSVSSDSQTTEMTIRQEDPYLADQERRDREAREKVRKRKAGK